MAGERAGLPAGMSVARRSLIVRDTARMADFTYRYPLNVPGRYYVDDYCLDCDLCRECAPNNIRRDDRTGISYVFKQPTTPEEVAAVEAGVEGCPTEGVGNDGDRFDWETTPIYDWNARYQKKGSINDKPDIHFDIRAPILREPTKRPWWRYWG